MTAAVRLTCAAICCARQRAGARVLHGRTLFSNAIKDHRYTDGRQEGSGTAEKGRGIIATANCTKRRVIEIPQCFLCQGELSSHTSSGVKGSAGLQSAIMVANSMEAM